MTAKRDADDAINTLKREFADQIRQYENHHSDINPLAIYAAYGIAATALTANFAKHAVPNDSAQEFLDIENFKKAWMADMSVTWDEIIGRVTTAGRQ